MKYKLRKICAAVGLLLALGLTARAALDWETHEIGSVGDIFATDVFASAVGIDGDSLLLAGIKNKATDSKGVAVYRVSPTFSKKEIVATSYVSETNPAFRATSMTATNGDIFVLGGLGSDINDAQWGIFKVIGNNLVNVFSFGSKAINFNFGNEIKSEPAFIVAAVSDVTDQVPRGKMAISRDQGEKFSVADEYAGAQGFGAGYLGVETTPSEIFAFGYENGSGAIKSGLIRYSKNAGESWVTAPLYQYFPGVGATFYSGARDSDGTYLVACGTKKDDGKSLGVLVRFNADTNKFSEIKRFDFDKVDNSYARFVKIINGNIFVGLKILSAEDFKDLHWLVSSSNDNGKTWAISDRFFGSELSGTVLNSMSVSSTDDLWVAGPSFTESGLKGIVRRMSN